ncbi:MAG TPA: hypothetical protein VIT65_19280 [Microlunatus sp.]
MATATTTRTPLRAGRTTADQKTSAEHNAGFPNYAANMKTLDANFMAWLTLPVVSGSVTRGLVVDRFTRCMDAPTYTLFSNNTSARAWNSNHPQDLMIRSHTLRGDRRGAVVDNSSRDGYGRLLRGRAGIPRR